ncbi:E3 ubiquitin-protein ligase BRE1-like 1 isoform X2 [Ricinus communis]|uniref:E3 ubiquitin-protein ligase BRE1-like 1 isoform X2 n=1 Tax=Ricinus communis TaxID=3988 RepID=UPI00201AAD44|nr:E3 ubiquitin-protein ligase BRE1-like 1 isoform X2 [Ricinus communis]
MGSTGEPDRKRRHFNSISSPTAAMAKKQPFSHSSEDKKLDTAVLQFQNQKLVQKLEAQKVEYSALENKYTQLKEKQQPYDSTLKAVNKSWGVLVTDLEVHSNRTRESNIGQNIRSFSINEDGVSSSFEDAFLSRLAETGATETSSINNCLNHIEEDEENTSEKIKNMLYNIVSAINDLWHLKDGLHAALLKEISEDGACRQKESYGLEAEVKNLRLALSDLHLKHKTFARELQSHRDIDAKNKAELNRLKGELESAVSELEESNCKLASLKAERDATKGAFFPVLNVGNKHASGDKARDKQRNLQEMESTLKELLDQASSRLRDLKALHDERIKILQQLSNLQNSLKNLKCISSSQAYILVRDQLEKSKSEVFQYQALYEKLQVERDNLVWREKELCIKNDLLDVFRRSSSVVESRIADLGVEIQRQIKEKNMIEAKLEEASREPGRKEIIAEFKALVSSFPEDMGNMQRQLSNYKEAASDIHSLRADVQSLSTVLDRKVKECESLSTRSNNQVTEIQKLQRVVQDLNESDWELKLIRKMYRHESTDLREVLEARDLEYKAWARVQSLKSSLDEQNLELRVKTANEAEAISQQRLAAAEAEIADLRQKLEASKRDISKYSDVLKSKNEENEAYLSEIETTGQAYDDMQTQNQHLLQQITERDDYNIKLVLEGLRARQLRDTLLMDKRTMEREIQQANISLDFYNVKAARIDDQVHKLAEEKFQNSGTLENTQKRLLDVRKSSNQVRDSLEDSQSKAERSRAALLELQIELERERFDKRRIEEDLEVARRRVLYLQAQTEGSSILEKLQQELKEYREIVKCNICLERPKEVVITKCFHLFCNPCVQRIIESRHRKCPACATNFGSNDVKPVYI